MAHREIVPATIVEVADAGEAHAFAVDDRAASPRLPAANCDRAREQWIATTRPRPETARPRPPAYAACAIARAPRSRTPRRQSPTPDAPRPTANSNNRSPA